MLWLGYEVADALRSTETARLHHAPGGAAAAWPLAARAQQPAGIRRVGVLLNLSENDVEAQRLVKAFREGLAQ